jgi:hypothetical protein
MGSPRQSPLRRLFRRLRRAPVFAPPYRRSIYWWAGTRTLLMLWALNYVPYFSRGAVLGDVVTYSNWSSIMVHGSFPASDPEWQYPPAAALVMLFPKILAATGIGYIDSFFIFALIADFAVLALLVGQADRISRQTAGPGQTAGTPYLAGVWAWVLGGFALGPILFMRYDVIVTALAVGGMVYTVRSTAKRGAERAESRTWLVRGALLGLGAVVKVWPVVLLLGAPPAKRGRRTLTWAVISAAGISAVLAVSLNGALSFVSKQGGRGIEVESVLASPFMMAAWFGYPAQTVHEFGNFQISGPGADLVGGAAIFLTLLGFAAVLWWRLRRMRPESWTPALMYDVGFTTLLIMVVTSRVLSPQYLVWLIGTAALCLAEHGPGRRATLMYKPAMIVMGCTLVSQVEFPLLFGEVMYHGFWGTALVAARNTALVVATVMAMRALWRSTKHSSDSDTGPGTITGNGLLGAEPVEAGGAPTADGAAGIEAGVAVSIPAPSPGGSDLADPVGASGASGPSLAASVPPGTSVGKH